jgi:hypothetical protein
MKVQPVYAKGEDQEPYPARDEKPEMVRIANTCEEGLYQCQQNRWEQCRQFYHISGIRLRRDDARARWVLQMRVGLITCHHDDATLSLGGQAQIAKTQSLRARVTRQSFCVSITSLLGTESMGHRYP